MRFRSLDPIYQYHMLTPLGYVHIVVNDSAIVRLYFSNERKFGSTRRAPQHPLIVRATRELREYFSGKRKYFTLPLAPHGTPFQKRVWNVLSRIPYGTTLTYLDEAKRVGKKTAVRAVANANGRNPLPILIPCHRVVGSGGTLGGYSGGLWRKRALLALERSMR